MKRKKLKKEEFMGEFYAHVHVWIGKDDDGEDKMSMILETSNPFKMMKNNEPVKKQKKRVDRR